MLITQQQIDQLKSLSENAGDNYALILINLSENI